MLCMGGQGSVPDGANSEQSCIAQPLISIIWHFLYISFTFTSWDVDDRRLGPTVMFVCGFHRPVMKTMKGGGEGGGSAR